MLFLKSWLAQYINISNYTDEEISDIVTLTSSEVDDILPISDYFPLSYGNSGVVVGMIQNPENHPEADRLKIFTVDTDSSQKALEDDKNRLSAIKLKTEISYK